MSLEKNMGKYRGKILKNEILLLKNLNIEKMFRGKNYFWINLT